jgi:hypothetical protein
MGVRLSIVEKQQFTTSFNNSISFDTKPSGIPPEQTEKLNVQTTISNPNITIL